MSFTEDSGLGPELFQQPEGDPGNQPPQQEQQVPVQPVYSPYAQNYLNGVPEAERELVGRHIQNWDKGFQKYAQQVQGQLRSYADLGDVDSLKVAQQVYQRLIDDPHSVADWLAERGITPRQAQQIQQAAQQAQQNPQGLPGQQELNPVLDHPEFKAMKQQLDRMNQAMGLFAEDRKQRQAREQQEAADRELAQYLDTFSKTYKGVPEQFVMAYMHSGITDMQQIAQAWQDTIQGHINTSQANRRPPNVVGATTQGQPPQDVTNMTRDQRQEAFKAALGPLLQG